MNPRQRRGVVLMVLSVVVAVGVFAIVTNYVREVSSQVGPLTTVYRAVGPIEAYQPFTEDNVEPVEVPARWTSPSSQLELGDIEGRRAPFRLEAETVVTADMLIPTSDLSPTEREIAINVNSVTGVAGRVAPNDRVDIYAVFEDVPGLPAQVRVLVRDVRVVTVEGERTVRTNDDEEGLQETSVLPVTLALEPDDALSVTYANAFAAEVRLVALPTDVGTDRTDDTDDFDAGDLGGQPVAVEAP
ncbi:Flp pilus assembly protein CpaB [Aquipuribacter hungaricus]|uniref:Flp pilus assembly protein CpaB n=1 Tax=Aquipuribacter hungaricus TaxID=545624 RepID=A0ABV7WMG8_9MICO